MLQHHGRTCLAAIASLLAAAPLVLAAPSVAAAQTSWGFSVVIGRDQGRPARPAVRGGVYWTRNSREFQFAYSNGYTDGYDKGRSDGRARRPFDPNRHKRYRSADHNYDRHHGPRIEYEYAYRDGFWAGYEAGYREARVYRGYPRDRDDWRRPY
jgi:hypothetical protein